MNLVPQGSVRRATIATIFAFAPLALSCGAEPSERPPSTPAAAPAPAVPMVFDVPALVGKSIDEIRENLGPPDDSEPEPTRQQIQLGAAEWSNTFSADGQVLLVTFNPRTRSVVDLFLPGEDRNLLVQRGNLASGNTEEYLILPVQGLRDPSRITGIKIVPKR